MTPATALIRAGQLQGALPYERFRLPPESWALLPGALLAEPTLALLGLWGEPGTVHAAFLDEAVGGVILCSAPARDGRYAALSPARPGASLMERAARDLWGLVAEGGTDGRPWLDHGRWVFDAPLSAGPVRRSAPPPQPEFLPVAGEGVHQVSLGPVRDGVAEPAHLRFHVRGETVLRLEARLGYAHKGTIGLMLGKTPRTAARFAARLSGDSTVAHGWAFALAAEAATDAVPPPRATVLRAVMAELERVANHLRDWGNTCAAAGFPWLEGRCGLLREMLLRACAEAFGHRLMMERVIPGGVAADLDVAGDAAIRQAVAAVAAALPGLVAVFEGHAGLADRLGGTGVVSPELAARFAAGGVVGRASGRGMDARAVLPLAPYGEVSVPVLTAGDAAARLRVRIAELRESLRLLPELLDALPPGEVAVPLPSPPRGRAGEGVGIVESFRGEVLHWIALDETGLLRAAFPRDPSWLHWPLLEAAMAGGSVADFALCAASINPSCSGVDL
ncbi:hydrogenase expression protein HypE [Roseomonas sp. BN140053]|uniref:hydrogenase large subunit n=1 Tax=Roseomonas sp. BN140053 TaxID=3391898 RepID=UPI0039EC4C89